ncbi:glucose transporter GlcU [Carnobacterium divergens]|uniref:GRP family sugar transporter n=1 Tax=Carnobacterium divergens TaxID=2748 RepID=A0AAW8R717_CARDV|nr:GRP family sugar transporter [Carnobacterium divergens]ANZ99405.1 glucose transporter GlcU [Carnobacterium divergens]MDT1958178.1 GRP family sugar transporter [Carnobacterium divergens]MDT1973445.1 GRP family sugar transporter [Carnobacterium divergens]MDT1995825.1 GRP family sugar transporter [Carnobacterium divergens]MDT2011600.1 GRP family sugar transporter [Carnobacterium divergens]
MDILIAMIPAIAWGSIGLVSNKVGGTAYNQTLGMTIGAFIFSIGIYFVYQPAIDMKVMIAGVLSGLFWVLGQQQQFQSMKYMGVSGALPISTGGQLIANTLAGAILFGEWQTTRDFSIGTIALIILILGARFTAVTDHKEEGENHQLKKGLQAIAISTIGYALYTITVKAANVDAMAVILPQSVGMLIGAIIFSIKQDVLNKYTARNLITGLLWAIGNIFMLIAMKKIGLAVSFSLSQTGIIISTLGGIWLLGEKKTKREFRYVIIGCLLVIAGGMLLGYLKA